MHIQEESKNSLKTLKVRNRRLVLSYMRGTGSVSVNEISHATGLSKMTVHKIIDHYLAEGMINFSGKGVSTEEGGKKPNLFAFNAHCRYIFVARIDGPRAAISLVNLKGEPVVERRELSLENLSFEDSLEMIAGGFHSQVRESGLPLEHCMAAVIGCNGIVNVERGICLASYQMSGWGTNLPVRESLRRYFPEHIFIHVDSWWRLMAHGEIHFAQGGDRARFFLIGNYGDYVSGGLVKNGFVCSGANGLAGEIGHMIVAPDRGGACVCGGNGCLESLIAPTRLMAAVNARRQRFPNSRLFADGDPTDGDVVRLLCAAADQDDPLAREVIDEVVGFFAVAVNNIMHICDPGVVVLFGDYAAAGSYFLDTLRNKVRLLSLRGIDKQITFECSTIGDEHGIIGAACHMTDAYFVGER